jgi:hypothetical protein
MQLIGRVFRNALPFFLHKYLYVTLPERKRERKALPEQNRIRALTIRNAELRDRHRGARCFILCNGPSVKKQNIRPLKDELVISVSSGYHHPDYSEISPAYHCVPQITYGMMTRTDVIAWFREMHDRLGRATLFLNQTEEPLVREENLFSGRDVRYVSLQGPFSQYPANVIPDLTSDIPAVQSVPIMALLIGMYMGASQLYLLGTDHDHFRSGEYIYFYESTVLRGKDVSVDEQGKLRGGWYEEFSGLAALWAQYRSVKQIAIANNVRIFNATAGGELDEFPRVALETLVAG